MNKIVAVRSKTTIPVTAPLIHMLSLIVSDLSMMLSSKYSDPCSRNLEWWTLFKDLTVFSLRIIPISNSIAYRIKWPMSDWIASKESTWGPKAYSKKNKQKSERYLQWSTPRSSITWQRHEHTLFKGWRNQLTALTNFKILMSSHNQNSQAFHKKI